MDAEGYGERPGQTHMERLLEDSRTLSPAGVERVATGWDKFAGADHERYHESERAALRIVEATGRAEQWEELRNELLGLTERGTPMVAWRVEHGEIGHKAEAALLGAALAFAAGPELESQHRERLLRPMGEALPWLAAAR